MMAVGDEERRSKINRKCEGGRFLKRGKGGREVAFRGRKWQE